VPAPDHYAPSAAGTVNRVNVAAVGLAILLYAGVVLLVRMLCRLTRAPSVLASLGVAAAALGLGGAYLGRDESEARMWDAAGADQRSELADVRLALPRLPLGATVSVYGAPATVGPGVPVLNTKLDLSSALRIAYDDPTLVGVLVSSPASVRCGASAAVGDGVAGALWQLLRGGRCLATSAGSASQRMLGSGPGSGQRAHVAHRQARATGLADAVLVDRAAAAAVLEHDRRAGRWAGVAVAPLHQRDDRRPQVKALVGEAVFVAPGMLLVEAPLEHALVEQARQARVEHVARDPQIGLDLVEAAQAEQHVAHDQQRPALADHLQRAGEAAHLVVISIAEHGSL
jgi:hypothetical protein